MQSSEAESYLPKPSPNRLFNDTMAAYSLGDAMGDDAIDSPPLISIGQMPHIAYVRRGREDWAGITDRKERKRLQNRLNQRARK